MGGTFVVTRAGGRRFWDQTHSKRNACGPTCRAQCLKDIKYGKRLLPGKSSQELELEEGDVIIPFLRRCVTKVPVYSVRAVKGDEREGRGDPERKVMIATEQSFWFITTLSVRWRITDMSYGILDFKHEPIFRSLHSVILFGPR